MIYVRESVGVVYVFLCQCMDGSLSCCLFAVVVVYWWWQRHSSALHQLRALRSFTFSFLFTFHFSFVLIFKKKRQQQKSKSTKNIIKDSCCDYHDDVDERDSTDSHTNDDQQQQREKLAANKAKRAGGQTIRQAGKPETKQVTTPFALSYSGSTFLWYLPHRFLWYIPHKLVDNGNINTLIHQIASLTLTEKMEPRTKRYNCSLLLKQNFTPFTKKPFLLRDQVTNVNLSYINQCISVPFIYLV